MNNRTRTIERFERRAVRRRLSERTARIYAEAAERLDKWLIATADDREFLAVGKDDLEDFLYAFAKGKDGFDEHADSYVNQTYRSLVRFYASVAGEAEAPNPMVGVEAWRIGEESVYGKVLTDEQLSQVMDTVRHNRRDFYAIRDYAILRLFLLGMRREEVATLTEADIDLDKRLMQVEGKGDRSGSRTRVLRFGVEAADALDRYLEARERHADAWRPELWLGKRGALEVRGFNRMVRKRGAQAGIDGLTPHKFRHTTAHRWLADGGDSGHLMEHMGWKSADMLKLYAKETRAQRARDEWDRRGLDDRI